MQRLFDKSRHQFVAAAWICLIIWLSGCTTNETASVERPAESHANREPADSDEADIDVLIQQLSSERAKDRYSAAVALGHARDRGKQAIPKLIELLDDQEVAIESRKRNSSSTEVCDGAFAALVAIGSIDCAGPCIDAWQKSRGKARAGKLLRVLSRFNDNRVVEFLLSVIADDDETVSIEAIRAVSSGSGTRFNSVLCKKLTCGSSNIVAAAASALTHLADSSCLDPILSVVSDNDCDYLVRSDLLFALGRIDDERSRIALRTMLGRTGSEDRISAIRSLGRIGNADDRNRLIQVLRDSAEDERIRFWTAEGLLRATGSRNARDDVITLASSRTEDDKFRCRLIDALGKIERERCLETVASIVRDRSENEVVRCGAAIVVAEVLNGAVESLDLVGPLTFPYKLAVGLDPEAETRSRRREAIELVAENSKTPSVRDFANRLLRAL